MSTKPKDGTKRQRQPNNDQPAPEWIQTESSKQAEQTPDLLNDELRKAIKHMVANISKSFIVEWYTSISPTNHDFVVCCEALIENALTKLAELSVEKFDKYKIGQLVASLLHDHVLNENLTEKTQSIEQQIDNYEYDICQNSVVRLFGLLCTDDLRRVIFTNLTAKNFAPRLGAFLRDHQNMNRRCAGDHQQHYGENKTTSALYTLVIAMLTKAVFMPIVDSISAPKWLYAVIIWLCKKEEREQSKRLEESMRARNGNERDSMSNNLNRYFRGHDMSVYEDQVALATRPHTSIIVTNTMGYRSVDLEEGIDIASANINFDTPICDSLKRPLDNIEIYATEEVKSNNSCYVLYCIRYDGLCHRHPSAGFSFIPEHPDLPVIDKRATNVTSRRLIQKHPDANARKSETLASSSNMMAHSESNRKYFRRKMTIKRRFREFVLLQLRLEENPKIRPYMKNIPKPTKLKAATQSIFTLPGITNIKLDPSTIKLRRRFLERFLTALNSSPFIANSFEFKEFFSYNVNSVNISKSKSLILQVNLNKVFVDSLRSAFSIIKSSLPDVRKSNDDLNLGSSPDPDAWLTELQQSTLKLHVQTRTSHSKMNLERLIDSKLLSMDSKSSAERSKSLSLDRKQPNHLHVSNSMHTFNYRGGSLRSNMVKSSSTGSTTNSSSILLSRSSSSNSRHIDDISSSSPSSSSESIYYDAQNVVNDNRQKNPGNLTQNNCNSIQICDSIPIASKFIDVIHYSISKNSSCSSSLINFIARLVLGRIIERHAIRLLEAALNLDTATFCINGITSSIWDESDDDPPLDMENASLDGAVFHLTKLIEANYEKYTFIPKQFLSSLVSKQIRFYLSQLASQKRNKFVIYSFFVHILDELEESHHQ